MRVMVNCKYCSIEFKKIKPWQEFCSQKCRDGYAWKFRRKNSFGKKISNRKYTLSKYKLNICSFFKLYEKQKGKCAICKCVTSKQLNVDHCHKTGLIRGLLCSKCNVAIGLFGDNIQNLQEAIRYLNASKIKE